MREYGRKMGAGGPERARRDIFGLMSFSAF